MAWVTLAYFLYSNGFTVFTPSALKSRTFRVATVSRCTAAVAAIKASSASVSDLPCISRAHSRHTAASSGSSCPLLMICSSHDSIWAALVSSCSRVISTPRCSSPIVIAEINSAFDSCASSQAITPPWGFGLRDSETMLVSSKNTWLRLSATLSCHVRARRYPQSRCDPTSIV